MNTPTEAAKVLRRQVYERIEECYNSEKKRYRVSEKGRFSDKIIAEEFVCAPELVAKIREEFFGDDTVPCEPEILKELQIEIAYLKNENENILNLAKGLRQQASDWKKRTETVEAQINGLCAEYGWLGKYS